MLNHLLQGLNLTLLLFWMSSGAQHPGRVFRVSSPQVSRENPLWRIAFVRNGDLWVSDWDGTHQKRIVRAGELPSWSPDKKQIAFRRRGELWIADASGNHQRLLLSFPEKENLITGITWNPKTDKITFARTELLSLQRDGKKVSFRASSLWELPLSPNQKATAFLQIGIGRETESDYFTFSHNATPAWSPDGNTLAFSRNGDLWGLELAEPRVGNHAPGWQWTASRLLTPADFDETNLRASQSTLAVASTQWSKDGKWLAFSLERFMGSGIAEIHLLRSVRKNGERKVSQERVLVTNGRSPGFSPDSHWLCYGTRDAPFSVYTISLNGKQKHKILDNASQPAW